MLQKRKGKFQAVLERTDKNVWDFRSTSDKLITKLEI